MTQFSVPGPDPTASDRLTIGWREWLALPTLQIPAIKAKVDTGARTSALHTFRTETFRRGGRDWVRFAVHPLQRRSDVVVWCTAPLLARRVVSDSGGHREERHVVETLIRIGELDWPAELTLTDRDSMLFRMLLGRTAIAGRILVDPAASYLAGKRPKLDRLYARGATRTITPLRIPS
jgi:hypothetical protein